MAGRRCGRWRDACGRDPMPCAERMANDLTLTLLLISFAWCAGSARVLVRRERYPPCFFAERFRRMHPGVVVVYVMRCSFLLCFVVTMCGIPGCRDSPRDQDTAPPFPAPASQPGRKGEGIFFSGTLFWRAPPPYKRSSLLQLPLRKEKYKKKPTRGRIVSAVPTNQKDTAPCRVSLEKEVSK